MISRKQAEANPMGYIRATKSSHYFLRFLLSPLPLYDKECSLLSAEEAMTRRLERMSKELGGR